MWYSEHSGCGGGAWWIQGFRSHNPIISLIRQCLPDPLPIATAEEDDYYKWKLGPQGVPKAFSASATWNFLHPCPPAVTWNKAFWSSGRIPKHAFICWVAARDRLYTRDRLRDWGLIIPTVCLLCNSVDESRDYLFFNCPYSQEVWTAFTTPANVHPPLPFALLLNWMASPPATKNAALIIRFAFQASLYAIWKERNSRLYSAVFRPTVTIVEDIKRLLRARLDSLSQALPNTPSSVSYLSTWFSIY
ncbi:unnamed protein product [Thlaspi arvense]|uniref:Reverse transcriptase zinc-binding domain-containing protein n=1 Tax=Thlaspi arvense TaxID=13288 RepID=A0AAU9RUZ7_THLAR|nr:unnamed protein product [Thlaspi arvense]